MTAILGGMAPARFVHDHWQKRPLLVRQAIPRFRGIVARETLFRLAARKDAIARLVIEHPRRRSRWERHDGPFAIDQRRLPPDHVTLLVHGVESLLPGGWELLGRFAFMPARAIDDLMVSWAARAGSVGPHDDRYDVFLLQGPGRRRWQLARGGDRATDPAAAIKVLKSFVPEEEYLLEPGDMLYLPPGVAHFGVAEEECFTYSIGFLAPSHFELAQSFLGFLGNTLPDPDALLEVRLRLQDDRLAVDDATVRAVGEVLGGIAWDAALVEDFVGCFLTRPKPHVCFSPPARPLSMEGFARRLRGRGGLTLALASRGLVRRGRLYFNGEAHAASRATLRAFTQLVDRRRLVLPLALERRALEAFHRWYLAGQLGFRRPA